MFSPSRTVMIMCDEGLQLYAVTAGSAKFVDFISWESDEFDALVPQLLMKQCRGMAVLIVNDMVEQHYRKEKIPKVSPLDKANVLKRRLGLAFPNYQIRAALKLQAEKGAGGSYLFAAIPAAEPFKKVIRSIGVAGVQVVGLCLLPVEASVMVKSLSAKLNRNSRYKPVWTIFVGQHHKGSLRQIVTKNGELALTRITPIVDTDVEPVLWAKELNSELQATMSYLSRFGYKETDGLDVVVVANEEAGTSLEQELHLDANLHVMNAAQISKLVGVPIGPQEDLRYADPLHAGFVGRKSRFLLPMSSTVLRQLTEPRKYANYALLGLMALAAYVGYDTFKNWQVHQSVRNELVAEQERRGSVQAEHADVVKQAKELGFDFTMVSNSLEIFDDFNKQKMKPLLVIQEVSSSLDADVRLEKIKFETKQQQLNEEDSFSYDPRVREENAKIRTMNAFLKLTFSERVEVDVGVRKVEEFRTQLRRRLPEYEVSIVKQVADLSYSGEVTGGSNPSGGGNPEQFSAEILIQKEI